MNIQKPNSIPAARPAPQASVNEISGLFGETLNSRLLPDYASLVKNGYVYSAVVSNANPSAFSGGAAGTPLVGILNPAGSGKDLYILDVIVGVRTTGTATANVDFNHFAGVQGTVAMTGVQTAPRNMYSQQAAGSVAQVVANVVNTGAVASNAIRPSLSLGVVPVTATALVGLLRDEVKGEIVVAPGTYYAFGAVAALTAAGFDVTVIWAEMPV